jgi:DNA-binding NarL/FixJ family response regulator
VLPVRSSAIVSQTGDRPMQKPDKLTVVIAHRDPFLSAGLARHLGNLAEFEPVVSGLELGAAITGTDSGDVVIADYDSGLEFLGSNSRWRDRVVIFTERDSESSVCHALDKGVRGYLLFGCGVSEMATAIRTVHEGGRALAPLVASRIAERIRWEKLTPSELDILGLLFVGLSNKEIARETSRTTETVKTHVKTIFRKLDARSRIQAVMVARRRGILQEEVSDRMRPPANLRGGSSYGGGPLGGNCPQRQQRRSLDRVNI